MSTVESALTVEGSRALLVAGLLHLVDDDKEVAWAGAREHIVTRPDFAHLVSRFVSTAPEGNRNGHIFDLEQTKTTHRSVLNTPLNLGHRGRDVVGTCVATDLLYPNPPAGQPADAAPEHPHVETLHAFWKGPFRDEFDQVKRAQQSGAAWVSMEAIPKSLVCKVGDCAHEAAWAGLQSDTYCDHLNTVGAPKLLNWPTFVGTGIIMAPQEPGWRRADIHRIDAALRAHPEQTAALVAYAEEQVPWLPADVWDQIMAGLLEQAHGPAPEPTSTAVHLHTPSPAAPRPRSAEEIVFAAGWEEWYGRPAAAAAFTAAELAKMAAGGVALRIGDKIVFPIPDVDHLRRAIQSYGRAKPADRAKVRAHIVKRARALGQSALIPAGWKPAKAATAATAAPARPAPATMPEGPFGVDDVKDADGVRRAADRVGQLPPPERPRARLLVIRKARALGCTSALPSEWGVSEATMGWADAWAEAAGAPSSGSGEDDERSDAEMQDLIDAGVALPDPPHHPIPTVAHLQAEVRDFPTVPPSDMGRVRDHIVRRAGELNARNMLPAAWVADAGTGGP